MIELPKGGDLPWALFYPEHYSIGSASLGYQYVFQSLRAVGVAAERFFASPIPYRSVDADTLLERFSVISASVAYEGGIPVFFKWLADGGIPLSAAERARGGFPVVGLGGALTYINPLSASGVCDFIILGDGLQAVRDVAEVLRIFRRCPDRARLWEKLAEIPEVFVPPVHINNGRITSKLAIGSAQPLNGTYPSHSAWLSPEGTFGRTLLLELQRGCARACPYCTLPQCFGKMRYRDISVIRDTLEEAAERGIVPQAGLVTPEAGDYPFLSVLLDLLSEKKMSVSFASLRLDRLNEKMLSVLAESGRRSVTVAPEAGTESLRFSLGKKFTDDLIIEKLLLARKMGIDRVKLYFMIGLPGEEEQDISGITSLCSKIIAETGQSLTLSVNPFVPKPRTAWQMKNFAGTSTIKRKYEKIKHEMRNITRKTPQLRLTPPKEAEAEFRLAWYGYSESIELAAKIEAGDMSLPQGSRETVAEDLASFA